MGSVFLTGASGFLGGHLLRELRATGCSVRALSRRAESDAAIAAAGGVPVRGALDDGAALDAALDGCEAVFHAAADTRLWRPYAAAQTATNVGGTERLLHAAERAGVRALSTPRRPRPTHIWRRARSARRRLSSAAAAGSTTSAASISASRRSGARRCARSSSTRRTSSGPAIATTGRA